MKRKFKITVTKVYRRTAATREKVFQSFCPFCKREVEIISRAEAAFFLAIEEKTLDQFVGGGKVHAVQTVIGNFWICKNSLFQNGNSE